MIRLYLRLVVLVGIGWLIVLLGRLGWWALLLLPAIGYYAMYLNNDERRHGRRRR